MSLEVQLLLRVTLANSTLRADLNAATLTHEASLSSIQKGESKLSKNTTDLKKHVDSTVAALNHTQPSLLKPASKPSFPDHIQDSLKAQISDAKATLYSRLHKDISTHIENASSTLSSDMNNLQVTQANQIYSLFIFGPLRLDLQR